MKQTSKSINDIENGTFSFVFFRMSRVSMAMQIACIALSRLAQRESLYEAIQPTIPLINEQKNIFCNWTYNLTTECADDQS